jgi:transcriptional regulator with XRE-family HTH domain
MAMADAAEVLAALARNVREGRRKLGLSQEALADEAGVDRTFVSQIERQMRNVTVATVVRLAGALGTTVDRLLVAHDHPDTGAVSPRRTGPSRHQLSGTSRRRRTE